MKKIEKLTVAISILLIAAVMVNKFMIVKLDKDLVGDGRYFFKTVFTERSYFNRYYKATLDEEGVFFEIHYDPVDGATYESQNLIDEHYRSNMFWYEAKDENKYIWGFTTLVILLCIVAGFPSDKKYRLEQLTYFVFAGALAFSLYMTLPVLYMTGCFVTSSIIYYLLRMYRIKKVA